MLVFFSYNFYVFSIICWSVIAVSSLVASRSSEHSQSIFEKSTTKSTNIFHTFCSYTHTLIFLGSRVFSNELFIRVKALYWTCFLPRARNIGKRRGTHMFEITHTQFSCLMNWHMNSSYIFFIYICTCFEIVLYPIYFHSKINIWQTLKFLNFLLQIVWCAPGLVTHVVVGVNIDVFNNNRSCCWQDGWLETWTTNIMYSII